RIPTTTLEPSSPLALFDPVISPPPQPLHPTDSLQPPPSFDPRALQSAVVRISLLIASIQRALHANPGTSPQPNPNLPYTLPLIHEHMANLSTWTHTLPAHLQLSALYQYNPTTSTASNPPNTINDNPLTMPQRTSMLLAHCKYLS